jgi:hypothetical protein
MSEGEIPIRETGEVDEFGEPVLGRYMTAEEIEERLALNIANTSEALRRRVLEELAKENGYP